MRACREGSSSAPLSPSIGIRGKTMRFLPFSRRSSARVPVSDHDDEVRADEAPAAPAAASPENRASWLRSSIVRGTAEGVARESMRKLFDWFVDS